MTKGVQLGDVPAVNIAIANCLKARGIPIEEAAKMIHRSPRQLARDIKGQNKTGLPPPETVRDLYEASLIDEEAKDQWWPSYRRVVRLKSTKKTAFAERP